MNEINGYIERVGEHFKSRLGTRLVEAYKLGSLAHGGFSDIYSDLDVGLLLNCAEAPSEMPALIAEAKNLDAEYGKKLSVFWGNPAYEWGRLPVIDRIDLLDHGVPMLHGRKPNFRRPTKEEVHNEQRESIERSWKSRLPELTWLTSLDPKDRKPYIRAILYAARLICTWDNLHVDSNDRAVAYLHEVHPDGLDLKPIDMALDCRNGKCTAEQVFALGTDLNHQCEATLNYIGATAFIYPSREGENGACESDPS